ncbi:4-(cytidine 5'-diphospho)-2-C-methyl-D-erythritol kinase [Alicyclobacillaceae bacterium I2511]|nr:4-(cytidine 5'-diphospho)-2-C-methyl-D-erythritol kinase [Alicyclobacillaceae bacterium I2511]
MVIERANAKINLTLDVLYKRIDGYHEVDMVLQTIDLADIVSLEETAGSDITVDATVGNIPLDSRNLAVVAAESFRRHSGLRKGVHIHIQKEIPVAAGLAGGSADAAAVLRGLNRLWGTGYELGQLAQWGAEIGSDVPFCVVGGCAVARGRGECLTPVDHSLLPWVVLVHPAVYVSTFEVYAAWEAIGEQKTGEIIEKQRIGEMVGKPRVGETGNEGMVRALSAGNYAWVQNAMHNDLAPVAYHLYPEVNGLRTRLEKTLQVPVHMSGSGPTLFTLAPSQTVARRIYNTLRGFLKEVYLSRFISV